MRANTQGTSLDVVDLSYDTKWMCFVLEIAR